MWITGVSFRTNYASLKTLRLHTCVLLYTFVICITSASKNSTASSLFLCDEHGQRCECSEKNVFKSLQAQCLLPARQMAGTRQLDNDDLIPSWANLTLAEIGQKFAVKNIGFIGVSHFFALILENFVPDIRDVLLATGSSNSPIRAVKRYTATATQVLLWYSNSITDPVQRRNILQSLRNVRKLHLDGAFKYQIKTKGDKSLESKRKEILQELWADNPKGLVFDERFWDALQKDLASSHIPESQRHFPDWKGSMGTPISQFAQSLTQFSFAGFPILFHKEMGMTHVTEEELQGYKHLWAIAGYALGIKDEFNICLGPSLKESMKLYRSLMDTYFIPALFHLDWRTRVQLGSYFDGLRIMDQTFTPRVIAYRFLRDIIKIRPWRLLQQFNPLQRMYLALFDSFMSNNLNPNRFLLNRGGMLLVDVNGYQHFGSHYSSEARKSQGTFYTREKLIIDEKL